MDVDLNAKEGEILSLVATTYPDYRKVNIKRKIYSIVKRTVDIVVALIGMIFIIPLTIVIYIAHIITGDEGPTFYKQYRIGKDGVPFKMYKYRTMVINADEELEKYLLENEDMKEEYHKYKKLRKDPRITKLGRFLRKTSLDEIPQLINVLKGDMSLIGPRPYLLKEKDDMGSYYTQIIQCKPGITGLWQVNGRSETTFEERLNIETNYTFNNSLKMDLKIFLKTIRIVLKKEGAV